MHIFVLVSSVNYIIVDLRTFKEESDPSAVSQDPIMKYTAACGNTKDFIHWRLILYKTEELSGFTIRTQVNIYSSVKAFSEE